MCSKLGVIREREDSGSRDKRGHLPHPDVLYTWKDFSRRDCQMLTTRQLACGASIAPLTCMLLYTNAFLAFSRGFWMAVEVFFYGQKELWIIFSHPHKNSGFSYLFYPNKHHFYLPSYSSQIIPKVTFDISLFIP